MKAERTKKGTSADARGRSLAPSAQQACWVAVSTFPAAMATSSMAIDNAAKWVSAWERDNLARITFQSNNAVCTCSPSSLAPQGASSFLLLPRNYRAAAMVVVFPPHPPLSFFLFFSPPPRSCGALYQTIQLMIRTSDATSKLFSVQWKWQVREEPGSLSGTPQGGGLIARETAERSRWWDPFEMFFKIMMEPLLFVRFYFPWASGRKCLTPEMDRVVSSVIGRLFVDWFALFFLPPTFVVLPAGGTSSGDNRWLNVSVYWLTCFI